MHSKVRLIELDALRGIACFSVMLYHCLLVLPAFFGAISHESTSTIGWLLANTPLHLFWAGHEAVLLFFIISGFVVSLPYYNGRRFNYVTYLIKKFRRIYIPYIVSIFLSVALMALLVDKSIASLDISIWFLGMWEHIPTTSDWIHLFFMMRPEDTHNVNTTTWCLYYIMQISIFLPLFILAIKRTHWGVFLVVEIIFSTLKAYILHYTAFFILGCLLAKHYQAILDKIYGLHRYTIVILAFLACFLYLFPWLVPGDIADLYGDEITGFGAVVFICLAIGNPRAKACLSHPTLLYLGRISYSILLIHPIVLLSTVYLLFTLLPLAIIICLVPLISVVVAHIFYQYVERPMSL